MTALTISDNNPIAGAGPVAGLGTTMTLTNGCSEGSTTTPCFTDLFVAGAQITPEGQPTQTVSYVNSDTQLTIFPGFTGTANAWTYNSYFITRLKRQIPSRAMWVIPVVRWPLLRTTARTR
jgi:hypothetical protein